jgi:hypothetical protein
MDTQAASKLELDGKIESYIMDNSVNFVFRENPKKEDEWTNTINLPFKIWEKFKGKDIKIVITKI